jgi:hypothetical protein
MKDQKYKYVKSFEEYKLIIPGYPEGSDLTILNTAYIGRTKNQNTDMWEKDYISILFRDNKTGAKKVHIIEEPLHTFYAVDETKRAIPSYSLFFSSKDDVKPITCRHADILKCVAEITGNLNLFRDNVNNGNSGANRKLHAEPNILMSDMDVENYYRMLFARSYTNNTFKLKKAYLDIEVDGKSSLNGFPEPGECPINAIAYCDEANNITYQFLLNDLKNPLLQEYKRRLEHGQIIPELKDFVINAVGGIDRGIKFGVDKMEYKVVFFDEELDLIETMFKVINQSAPDFLMIWNMAFDLTYIIARISELGGNPAGIICDPRVPIDFLRFYVDERNKNNYEERGDFVNISSYTVWIDQMIEFASIRKGRKKEESASFKLDAVGEAIAGVRKLDYSHITSDINALPMLNFKVFSFYNVMDVIVQKCIEVSSKDCEFVFTKCLVNNTVYQKCHRQSIYLSNRFAKDFYDYGFIIGNNKNKWNEAPVIKFPGAMVGNPLHVDQGISIHVNGKPTWIFDDTVDFDFASLYPNIILENNMSPNTQIGRVIIEDPENPNKSFSLNEHRDMFETEEDEGIKYVRGGEFIDNLITGNILEFCRRWLGLGDIYDVLDDITEYYNYNAYYGMRLNGYNDGVYFTKESKLEGLTFFDNMEYNSSRQGLYFYNGMERYNKQEMIETIRLGALL